MPLNAKEEYLKMKQQYSRGIRISPTGNSELIVYADGSPEVIALRKKNQKIVAYLNEKFMFNYYPDIYWMYQQEPTWIEYYFYDTVDPKFIHDVIIPALAQYGAIHIGRKDGTHTVLLFADPVFVVTHE